MRKMVGWGGGGKSFDDSCFAIFFFVFLLSYLVIYKNCIVYTCKQFSSYFMHL